MSDDEHELDLVRRLGDELVAAAERQSARPGLLGGVLARVRPRWPRRSSGRALVAVGAVVLAGAGGTAGVLTARGHVGGPPTLTFGRVSPAQQVAGIRALTRPVVFARATLPDNGRLWQLVGFNTSRGFCIDVDWPHAGQSGGCGTNVPREGRVIDYQGEIALRAGTERAVFVGAIAPRVASVRLVYRVTLHDTRVVPARVVHVDDPRVLRAMGLAKPFAYYVAEQVGAGAFQARVVAYDRGGRQLGRAGIPNGVPDTPGGFFNVPGQGCVRTGRVQPPPPRIVHTPAPAAVLDRFAVLRQRRRASDLLPASFRRGLLWAMAATVDAAEFRRLGRTSDGGTVYLVPQTYRVPDMTPPAGCLNTLTPSGRALEAHWQALASAGVARQARTLTSFIIAPGARGATSGPSIDLARWRAGQMTSVITGREIVGVVPDGVVRVDLSLRHGVHLSSAVHQNIWSVRTKTSGGRTWPVREVWRDARGRVVRTLRRG